MSWTRERVTEEVLAILRPHVQTEVALSETSHLVADLGIDSLGVMEVVADLEDKFKLHIPDEALREVDTVADVATFEDPVRPSEGIAAVIVNGRIAFRDGAVERPGNGRVVRRG